MQRDVWSNWKMRNDKELFILILNENVERIKYSESLRYVFCVHTLDLIGKLSLCGCYFYISFTFNVYVNKWYHSSCSFNLCLCLDSWFTINADVEWWYWINLRTWLISSSDSSSFSSCSINDNAKCHTCYHKIQ